MGITGISYMTTAVNKTVQFLSKISIIVPINDE